MTNPEYKSEVLIMPEKQNNWWNDNEKYKEGSFYGGKYHFQIEITGELIVEILRNGKKPHVEIMDSFDDAKLIECHQSPTTGIITMIFESESDKNFHNAACWPMVKPAIKIIDDQS